MEENQDNKEKQINIKDQQEEDSIQDSQNNQIKEEKINNDAEISQNIEQNNENQINDSQTKVPENENFNQNIKNESNDNDEGDKINNSNNKNEDEEENENESSESLIDENDYKQERDYEKGIGGPPPFYMGDEKKMKERQKLDEEMANFDEDAYQLPPLEIPAHEKQLGSIEFQKKNYSEAAKHYSKALLGLNILIKDDKITDEEKMVWYIENIQVPCNSNLALCYINLKEYQVAISYADNVVTLDQNNVKGLYRRALCNIYLGNYKQARQDLIIAQTLEPKNTSVLSGFELLKKQQEKQKLRMQNMSKKILGGMDYSEGQSNVLPQEVKDAQEKFYRQQNPQKYQNQLQQEERDKIYKKNSVKLQETKKKIQENLQENKKDFFYNLRIVLLTPLNILTDTCCRRKIPSQFFKKKTN